MNTPDFNAAAGFVAANARVLDRRRFQRLFEDGPAAAVRDAVAAYRNDDGGFGDALEPDCRAPGSQPAAAALALRIMDETDTWDEDLVGRATGSRRWLPPGRCGLRRGDADGLAARALVGPRGWHLASLVATGMIAGTLHARGVRHRWLDGATEVMWNRIAKLDAGQGGRLPWAATRCSASLGSSSTCRTGTGPARCSAGSAR